MDSLILQKKIMKRILLVLISLTITYANAQLIFHEPFNYLPSPTNGLASQSSGAWIKINTQDSILISSGSLDYAGLAVSSGNKVIFDGAGSDNYKAFSTQTSGTTYASFIINVSSLGGLDASGSYCANLMESNSTSAFAACVWLKASATPGKFLIGISNRSSGSTPVYFTSDMNTNESYFIVISYSIVTGTGNDFSKMWVNTTQLGGTEPTSTLTSNGGTDISAAGLGRFLLRQAAVATTPFVQLDELRVGTTWASVTPCASPTVYYPDLDGDTYGDANTQTLLCQTILGYVTNNLDCNDNNANINPNTIWYIDADADGFGNSSLTQTGCTQPLGYVSNNTDCNDNDPLVNQLSTWYQDADLDGFGNPAVTLSNCGQPVGYVANNTDCNDNNPNANQVSIWYADADGDGFGNPAVSQSNCGQPTGYVANSTDCNDNLASMNPSFIEIYDGLDNNCNGITDEGFTPLTFYLDADGDGIGGSSSVLNIVSPGPNYVLVTGDCNDANANMYPGNTEICDNLDNNCSGAIDENLIFLNYYQDLDGDNFGNLNQVINACSLPVGYVLDSTDCNDANNLIYPGAVEIEGNGIDEDCNGADAPLTPVMLGIYQFAGTVDCTTQDNVASNSNLDLTFANFSGVGTNCASGGGIFNRSGWNIGASVDLNQYNEFSVSAANCKSMNLDRVAFKFRPSGSAGSPVWHLRSSLDNFATDLDYGTGVNVNNAYLDDTVYLTNHSNLTQVTFRFYITEMLGTTTTWRMDDVSLYGNVISLTPQTFYADVDQDGFGDLANDTLVCTMPAGFVTNSLDCNDSDSTINPNTIWYMDMDGDLLGNAAMTFTGCTPLSGYVLNATDCNDTNANITGPIMYYVDADLDGFGDDATGSLACTQPTNTVTIGGDCNDGDNTIYPGITYYADLDQDGYGDFLNDSISCAMPIGFVSNSQDCNDADSTINPTTVWYMDMDGDLQGDATNTFTGCTPPTGYVLNDDDCDDSNANITAPTMYYVDVDNDGFGDDATGTLSCTQPVNTVIIGGDCNDNDTTIYPGAAEICDGFDNNCNGTSDEGLIFNTYYLDSDNDQFGAGIGLVSCQAIPIPGYVLVDGDCDDMNPNVYPGATDISSNDIDENCDGVDGYLGLTDVTSVQVGLVPNPSNGAFAIYFNSEVANANIQVTDMNGKVLFQQWINGTSLEVSNLRLSTGAYLVHVTLENQKEILRLIIQ
jgi:hypothetical protein